MDYFAAIGGFFAIGFALLIVLFVRHLLIIRGGGTVEVSLRLSRRQHGRGWAVGLARFSGDSLLWYRTFSLGLRPRQVLSRKNVSVVGRREPNGSEQVALPQGSVILECQTSRGPLEVAMAPAAPSGAAIRSSNTATVGFESRE